MLHLLSCWGWNHDVLVNREILYYDLLARFSLRRCPLLCLFISRVGFDRLCRLGRNRVVRIILIISSFCASIFLISSRLSASVCPLGSICLNLRGLPPRCLLSLMAALLALLRDQGNQYCSGLFSILILLVNSFLYLLGSLMMKFYELAVLISFCLILINLTFLFHPFSHSLLTLSTLPTLPTLLTLPIFVVVLPLLLFFPFSFILWQPIFKVD